MKLTHQQVTAGHPPHLPQEARLGPALKMMKSHGEEHDVEAPVPEREAGADRHQGAQASPLCRQTRNLGMGIHQRKVDGIAAFPGPTLHHPGEIS